MNEAKKKVVFTVTCLEKNGSVGQDFFFQPKQLKCTYWLSLCFTSINFVFVKVKTMYFFCFNSFYFAL